MGKMETRKIGAEGICFIYCLAALSQLFSAFAWDALLHFLATLATLKARKKTQVKKSNRSLI